MAEQALAEQEGAGNKGTEKRDAETSGMGIYLLLHGHKTCGAYRVGGVCLSESLFLRLCLCATAASLPAR